MCERIQRQSEMNEMANHKNARKLLRPKIKSEPEKQSASKSKSKYQLRPGLIDNKRINTIKTKRNEILRLGKSICRISLDKFRKMNRFLCAERTPVCVSVMRR